MGFKQVDELILTERQKLFNKLLNKMEVAYNLNRQVVSFQANKEEPIYRWFKYKEGFSSQFVKHYLTQFFKAPGKILDPFAGAGTTLFASQELGWEAVGVEILPVGVFVMKARDSITEIDLDKLKDFSKNLHSKLEKLKKHKVFINHISITKDAFAIETEIELNKYLTLCETVKDENLKTILRFAAFTILEEISFTRKDGQYLRWDYRSIRELSGKPFNKGKIFSFKEAIQSKLNKIINDLLPKNPSLFEEFVNVSPKSNVKIVEGSCLEQLPALQSNDFDCIITSPPYCNRYDYTRTYALELVFLGHDKDSVKNLRQSMLSCTVENKEKKDYLKTFYNSINNAHIYETVVETYNKCEAMNEVNFILTELNNSALLNNDNVPRMVKNYFLEMCFVIYEMGRVLKSGGYCIMVNDNVRYGGEEIPVDLILSDFAESFGFNVIKILVLPKGKGNSSQQMGNYGRTEVRKCVYIWQKI